MKERPILFSAPMILAIREGRETQTRRVINKQPTPSHRGTFQFSTYTDDEGIESYWNNRGFWHARCPYGKPGDRLWVRETFAQMDTEHCACYESCGNCVVGKYAYKADGNFDEIIDKWKPSIHMPRGASRILLEVTNVRVERLNDISDDDAIAEGIEQEPGTSHWKNYDASPGGWRYWESPIQSYRTLWESINGQGSWDLNPWVWVVEFKVIPK